MRKATNKSENEKDEDVKIVKTNKENVAVQKKATTKNKKETANKNESKKTYKVKAQSTSKKNEDNRLPNIEKIHENKKNEAEDEAVDSKINMEDSKIKRKKSAKKTNPEIMIKAKEETKEENIIEKEANALLKDENIEINYEKLEKIKNEINKSKKDSKDKIKNSNLRKNLVRNLSISIIITIYFLFIDLGINSIPVTVYMLDLKTFAIFIAIISIVIFEKAFKKDENYLAIHGIEMIVVGIETLLLLQLYSVGNEYFNYILLAITLGMIVYYLIKCLCIYIRYKVKGK